MKINTKIITIVLLVSIFILALFLRVYFSYGPVISDPVKYSFDDGVYHMRLVENELLGNHFPNRINFDPYTNFPNGTYIHFAPLYDWLLCLIIWLISFGHPTIKLINSIAPFYPAVMGSLIVFLVYFIAQKLWSKPIGLMSAFLVAIMPPLLFRSLIGATDHHVAEVFFSTLTMLCLVYLVSDVEKGNFKKTIRNKKFWMFTILTGLSLGLYFLTWTGALIFLFVIFCFINLYYLIRYLLGFCEEWILVSGIVIFSIALLMISPFFGIPDFLNGRIYNIQHFICFIGGILTFSAIGVLGYYLKTKDKKPYFLPVILSLGLIALGAFAKFFVPFIFDQIIKIATEVNTGMVDNKLARDFISEMAPMRIRGAFSTFSALFYLSLISFGVVMYNFVKSKKAESLLILVWTLIILFVVGIDPDFGQNRNSYYLSVIISLLASYIIIEGIKFGWYALREAGTFEKGSYLSFYFYVSSTVILASVLFLSLYPFPFNIDEKYPDTLPNLLKNTFATAGNPIISSDDWYDTVKWLGEKTPDPGIDYYGSYKAPLINSVNGKVEPYSYPPQAYGILAIWDVGHMITYYSHRIPVANPFQQGIGYINDNGTVEPGEATFFLSTNEKEATGYLDSLRAKYVVVDSSLANPDGVFSGYIKWINGNIDDYINDEALPPKTSKFDLAMSTRLYFLDGSFAAITRDFKNEKIDLSIPQLSHFRLVYESKNDHSLFFGKDYKTTKEIKVFEYVKGAKIIGYASNSSNIEVSTNIKTNQGREFIYKQMINATNGKFEIIVPYSSQKQSNTDVFASDYVIKLGSSEIKVKISENDILQGKTITIN
jgi:dolichyl-diphosphooligosaccharide--protein glycosyltransferase